MNIRRIAIGTGIIATALVLAGCSKNIHKNNPTQSKISDKLKLQTDSINLRANEDARIRQAKEIICKKIDSLARKAGKAI